jgi:hypothetical protein
LRASLRRFVPKKKKWSFWFFHIDCRCFLRLIVIILYIYNILECRYKWLECYPKKKKEFPLSRFSIHFRMHPECVLEREKEVTNDGRESPFFLGWGVAIISLWWVGGWHGEIATDPSVSSISAWNQSRLKELLSFHIIRYSCVCFLYNESVCHSSGKIFISSMDPLDNVDSDAIQIQCVTSE